MNTTEVSISKALIDSYITMMIFFSVNHVLREYNGMKGAIKTLIIEKHVSYNKKEVNLRKKFTNIKII